MSRIGKTEPGPFAVSVLAAVLATALGLLPYLLVYKAAAVIVAPAASGVRPASLPALAAAAAVAVALKGWLSALSVHMAHRAAYSILYDVRMAIAGKFAELPLGYFHLHDTGRLKQTMDEDVEKLEEGIAHWLPDVVSSAAVPLATTAMLLAADWRLALAALAFVPVLYGAYRLTNARIRHSIPRSRELNARLASAILQYVQGMKVIRAFVRSELSFAAFRTVVAEMEDHLLRVNVRDLAPKAAVVVLSRCALLVVAPIGALP